VYRDLPVNLEGFRKLFQTELGADPERLHAILADFYQRLSNDVLVGFFFLGHDLEHIARQQAAFLLRAFGAVPTYSGRPPAQAHLDLAPILSGHFDRRLKLLEETLRFHGLPDEAIEVWLGFENAFRQAIIQR
jgi:hemoglobin